MLKKVRDNKLYLLCRQSKWKAKLFAYFKHAFCILIVTEYGVSKN